MTEHRKKRDGTITITCPICGSEDVQQGWVAKRDMSFVAGEQKGLQKLMTATLLAYLCNECDYLMVFNRPPS